MRLSLFYPLEVESKGTPPSYALCLSLAFAVPLIAQTKVFGLERQGQ